MAEQMKIMVVDDSSVLRGIIRKDLEMGGYSIIEAADGVEALDLINTDLPPNLITLDVDMPKMDGFKTLEKLIEKFDAGTPSSEQGKFPPTIFVTGNDNPEYRKKGFLLGATDFIVKPFEKKEILVAVNKILRPKSRLRGMTALVVDDSKLARRIVTDTIKREGLTVLEAEDGLRAYEIMCTRMSDIDMVITDLEMPKMDGSELCARIRKHLGMRDTPIICLTSTDDQERVTELFKAGTTDYIIKPFIREELVARLTAHLERAQLNKRLRENVEELRNLNEMKDNLLTVCSHDLRTPLNSILGFSDLLLEKDYIEAEDREGIERIKTSGDFLLVFINDILDLSKIEAGESELEMEPLWVSDLVQASINAMNHLFVSKHQTFELINNLPDAVISGNQGGMIRTINNLLSNSIKFTQKKGRIKVVIGYAPPGQILIEVTDTGIGIPKDKIPHLFDKFTRTSQSGTSGEKGTGLGMSIVKEIIEKHGGKIDVDSKEGKGSSFYIYLPRCEEMPVKKIGTDDKVELPAVQFSEPINILLAEDYEPNRLIVKHYLKNYPIQVSVAENGAAALEKFSPGRFDLILMDVNMPVMDGYVATQEIRKIETQYPQQSSIINRQSTIQRVPVIAITAHSGEDCREKCLSEGMDDYLVKPLKKKDLLTMLAKWTRGIGGIDDCRSMIDDDAAPRGNNESEAPMGYERALEEFEGDEDFLMEVIEGFLENVSAQIVTMRQAISDGDAEAVRREAHAIKGGAANLTAEKLSGIAFELENIGVSGVLGKGIEVIDKLEQEFHRLKAFAVGTYNYLKGK